MSNHQDRIASALCDFLLRPYRGLHLFKSVTYVPEKTSTTYKHVWKLFCMLHEIFYVFSVYNVSFSGYVYLTCLCSSIAILLYFDIKN